MVGLIEYVILSVPTLRKPCCDAVLVLVSSLAPTCAYVNCKLLITLSTGNAPLKLVPAGLPSGKPLIKTVGKVPGTILCGVFGAMVMVTMLAVRMADAICNGPCEGLVRLTAVSV